MKLLLVLFIFRLSHLLSWVEGTQIEPAGFDFFNSQTGTTGKKELNNDTPLVVIKCKDFTIDGKGTNIEWDKARWTELTKLDSGAKAYESRFKILYSPTGIYVLFRGMDDKITTKDYKDFDPIYNGDVFEVFLHPIPATPVYFEYEVNALNKQLILTLSKSGNQLFSWAPRYPTAEDRKPIKNKVDVVGGDSAVGASISSWTAEVFLPYSILGLLPNVPPSSGSKWNANFCRLDYDSGNMIKYSWSPTIERSFHELGKFRSIRFE